MKADPRSIRSAIEALTIRAHVAVVRSGRGGAAPHILDGGSVASDDVVARMYRPDDLLDVRLHCAAEVAAVVAAVVDDLVDGVLERSASRTRQPSRPSSILMHGKGRSAMTVIVHELAYALGADLVQLDAPAVIPHSGGGCQPVVAPAVRLARRGRPSVLFIDQLETLVAGTHEARRQRALNDLLSEALRRDYGRQPVVIATYEGDELPPRVLTAQFDEECYVELPEIEEATQPRRARATTSARPASLHQGVQRGLPKRSSSVDSAA